MREFDLVFSGPFTKTVKAQFSSSSGLNYLTIPLFSDDVTSPSLSFTANLPGWIPLPSTNSGMVCSILANTCVTTGYITITTDGHATISSLPASNFINSSGLFTTTTIIYRS
jgi:hypothetical protein